jgi:hypothetical protein
MVCIQALAEDSAIAFAGSQGNFELNAMRPVIINNFLHSATILADACSKLRQDCMEGAGLHRQQIDDYVHRSRMLVTALSPVIGYDKASAIAHKASDEAPRCAKPLSPRVTSVPSSSTAQSNPPPWSARSTADQSLARCEMAIPKLKDKGPMTTFPCPPGPGSPSSGVARSSSSGSTGERSTTGSTRTPSSAWPGRTTTSTTTRVCAPRCSSDGMLDPFARVRGA